MSLIAEFKRRKVLHVAVAYAVVAWLLVQVVVTIEAPLNLPGWFDTATIVLFAVGFPLAVILSWVFDWTPRGIVRDHGEKTDAAPDAIPIHHGPPRVEGRSLRELVSLGPMSTSRLLSMAVRVADVLAKAHESAIVHRDVRPANVMITADGQIELVGFGSDQPVRSAEGTEASAYMAPERARGEPADFRADQFSLGATLYEMATGRRAFNGTNEAETLAAVIHVDPEPVGRINSEIPLPLQWAIERCLAKSPSERYSTTRELHGDLVSIADTFTTSTSARAALTHNLPAQRTPLIGREHELDEMKRLVLNRDVRLVTLTGAGGIGKTRLLIELGRQLLGEFRGGVLFAPLDRIQDSDLVASEIAKVLGAQNTSEHADPKLLQNHVRQHCHARTLLLLDNFEHLIEAAPLLADLLAATEQLEIVVTSRAALRVYGEHEFRVTPLHVPDRSAIAALLMQSPAIRLFLDRTSSVLGEIDGRALVAIAEICQRLDGLPLAIELAAARTKVLSLDALLERIRSPLQVLSGGPRDSPARQQTMRATLDWSYDLLEEDHQKLFRRLGVFVGGATFEGIEAVCNVDEDLGAGMIEGVESLVDNSMVRTMDIERSEPRFTMLETMREYALARLEEAGENAHIRRAHAAYCLVLAEESVYVTTETQREALYERFDRELGNLRAALDWLAETRDAKWGLRLANSLGHYWLQKGHAAEGLERMSKLIPLSRAEGESDLLVWGLAWASDLAANCANEEAVSRYRTESYELAKKRQILPARLRLLNGMAVQSQLLGDFESADRYNKEATQIAREGGGSPALVGSMLSNYADFAMRRGDLDLAQQLHEETAALFRGVGDEVALAWSLNHQGDIARRRRDFDSADRLYEESLAIFRRLKERAGIAGCLYDLAAVALDKGDCVTAEALNTESLSLYNELGHRAHIPRIIEGLVRCALESRDARRVLTLAGGAAAMRRNLSIKSSESTQAELERDLDAARQLVARSDAATYWMAGWSMSPEQAIEYALSRQASGEPSSA